MLRIFLILAILTGLGAAGVTFFKLKDTLVAAQDARDDYYKKMNDEKAAKEKEMAAHKKTQATLATTQNTLKTTQAALEAQTAKVADLDKQVTEQKTRLTEVTTARDAAQQQLEVWRQIGMTPQQVLQQGVKLKDTEKQRDAFTLENKLLTQKLEETKDILASVIGSNDVVRLPPNLRGTIVAVDPKYNFVVLNIGRSKGAAARGEMLVNHDGRYVAKLAITSRVTDTECVANIIPGSATGSVQEGDEVITQIYN